MTFWDSSALIPLLVSEKETNVCKQLLEKDTEILVWFFTRTEILSALHRKVREGGLSQKELAGIRAKLIELEKGWSEVVQIEPIRQTADRLLAVHSLRTADALQLAAALTAFENRPEREGFVTFDQDLAEAALREGFDLLPSRD